MAFSKPAYSISQVNKAGEILSSDAIEVEKLLWALDVLTNWRSAHAYPINTYQATLRKKLKAIEPSAIVAQRLKRMYSIELKLNRFKGMKLSRMQDIGGLRAVVSSIGNVRKLETAYRESRLKSSLIFSKDYIFSPKSDGYRGIHLIFKYKNPNAPEYDGLLLELQIRTKLQHAWATAVETMGTFLGQALKAGQGDDRWRDFFKITSSAIALLEKQSLLEEHRNLRREQIYIRVMESEHNLGVLEKLRGFSIAANHITAEKGHGKYHLIVLDSEQKNVTVKPFPENQLELANAEYASIEKRIQSGAKIEAVLVSAGPIQQLKKAYPNYFLDTQEFIRKIEQIVKVASDIKQTFLNFD